MPPTMEPLARCVGQVDEFLEDQFTRSPRLTRGTGFDDLLSLSDVDRQLSTAGLRRPAVRVVRDGELIDPATWTRGARTGAARIDDLVHPGRVLDLFGDGATIVLQSLQRWWAPLTRFCAGLEHELGHPVQANAYLTPSDAAGFTPHHDTHDVFVLQVHGTKHWVVREPVVADPLVTDRSDHEAAALQPLLFEVDLGPGDCLYLPRGFVHSAATQDGVSLHLTVGVLTVTVHDVLRRLVDLAAEEPRFRRTVRRPSGSDDRAELKGIVAELGAWIDGFDLDGRDDDEIGTLLVGQRRRAPMLDGQLLELANLDALSDDTVVVRRSDTPVVVRADGEQVVVDLGDRLVELPGVLRPALERFLDGRAHAVHEWSDLLDRSSRLVLARRLVRDGVFRTSDGA